MTDAWVAAAVALSVWTASCFALARRAEAHITERPVPSGGWALAAAVAVGIVSLLARATPAAALACGTACIALVAAADSDARTGYLFDVVTIPAAVLACAAAMVASGVAATLAGVVVLAGSFGAVVFFSRGRLMGLGDVKAMIAIGAAFGPLESLVAIFAACVSGIAVSAVAGRLHRNTRLPFGPHLAAGSSFALVAGDPIVHRLMGL